MTDTMNNRRQFIGSLGAFAALCGCSGAKELLSSVKPRLKFGVMSDIHCQYRAFTDMFERTLVYCRDRGADAVMVAGDMADMGMYEELAFVGDCWRRVFPGNRAPDGRHVEKLFVTGNHDVNDFKRPWTDNPTWLTYYCNDVEEMKRHNLCTREGGLERSWRECFDEKYEPIWHKRVKGYDFIGANWSTWQGVNGVEEYLNRLCPTLDPKRPFFFTQHPHPKGTVYGDEAWCPDDGRSTRALSKFPNAVAFTGHSHSSLSSPRSIWRGAFTSIGTSSLASTSVIRDGTESKDLLNKQALFVTVYDDFLSIERRDLVRDRELGEPWIVEVKA